MGHLTEYGKLLIYRGLAVGENKYTVAKRLGRSHTTIGRERECNKNKYGEYDSIKAENLYKDRRVRENKARIKLVNNNQLSNEIDLKLKNKVEEYI